MRPTVRAVISVAAAFRLVEQVYPTDQANAWARWAAAVRAAVGERLEVEAVLEGALDAGALSRDELVALGGPTFDVVEDRPEPDDNRPVLILRRHAEPGRSGAISERGNACCAELRSVGATTPSVSSPVARAVQTASALGAENVSREPRLGLLPDDIERSVGSHRSFGAWLDAYNSDHNVRDLALRLAHWATDSLAAGGVVAITHDDVIQLVTVATTPASIRELGGPLGYLEGVAIRLSPQPVAVRLGAPPGLFADGEPDGRSGH